MLKRLLLLIIICIVPLLVAAATYIGMHYVFIAPISPDSKDELLFSIESQASFRSIANQLQAKGLIRYAWAFNTMAQLKDKDKSILAGEYELSPSMSPEEILDKLVSGKMFARKVTLKEGMSIRDLPTLLEEAGIIESKEFEPSLADPELLGALKVPATTFEGYLFPETYQFPKGTSAKEIISKMVSELDEHWKPEFTARAKELNLNKHQILTLAPIVEKESGNFDEQPLVASVFHNRLKQNMRLQADPTVIYGIPQFNGNITKEDLLTPHAYNTYVIDGLPPAPIANPGIRAIEASLFPKETNYYYFVGDGQGRHIFSEDLTAHNKAVEQYQKHPSSGE